MKAIKNFLFEVAVGVGIPLLFVLIFVMPIGIAAALLDKDWESKLPPVVKRYNELRK